MGKKPSEEKVPKLEKAEKIEKLVPDTSVIIEGMVSRKVKAGEVRPETILIHEAVIAELEHQANLNKTIGFLGLDEIKRLKELSGEYGFSLEFAGLRPHAAEIRQARLGEIDSLIRQLAFETGSTLMTADRVQAEVAAAKNIPTIFVEIEQMQHTIRMESYFDESTMSVHLRENVTPKAKKGMPGNWAFKEIDAKPLAREEVKEMSREIIEEAGVRRDGFVEIERAGSTIVQLGPYRIVITRPPLSDGWEITAVRPVKKLALDDYNLSDKLTHRIKEQAEGILIAGAPGMGKCHGKGTPILMYDGIIKKVEEVAAGEFVMGPDSKPRNVVSTTRGFGNLYRVNPRKGTAFMVNESHILSLKYNKRHHESTVNIAVGNYLKLPRHLQIRYKGYRTAIEFPRRETSIEPYFLGLWLGDGLSASVRVANSEIEILEYLHYYALDNGLILRQHSFKLGTCQTYGITTGKRGGMPANGLMDKMKAFNLINNKHIPEIFKINDKETRLQVLAGIIDTDGYLTSNCFEVATKFEKLRDDLLYLARSLGFAAYCQEKVVKGKKYFRIQISGDIALIPTRIKRKVGQTRQQVKNVLRTGIEIESIGQGEYYGFELDKDGLYCLGDFTVTHNSTFAQALAEHYASQDKIVKTVEAPRDLLLPDSITQYAISHGSPQEIHDILLLSRPDYTIFDEMRNTADFELFADLRLAGIGLAGVVHATNPIDAIQRFVGRIELGVIPQIIDTVIFIKNGFVGKVLSLNMTVKVPEGMTEADLARPVVVVNDFETGKLEYELYSYGEETVVIPVSSLARSRSPIQQFAASALEAKMKEYVSNAKVEMISDRKCVVYVPENEIARLIGKEGKNIAAIEEKLGVGIDVQPLSAKRAAAEEEGDETNIAFDAQIGKKHAVFTVDGIFANKNVNILVDDDYVMTANVGKDGVFKISRKNKLGKVITDAVSSGSGLKVTVSG